jgi:hypothetical protein
VPRPDDRDTRLGACAHRHQCTGCVAEGDRARDELRGIKQPGRDIGEQARVVGGCHAVAAVDAEFAADDRVHGDGGVITDPRRRQQPDLQVAAVNAQAARGAARGGHTAEGVDGHVDTVRHHRPDHLRRVAGAGIDRDVRTSA